MMMLSVTARESGPYLALALSVYQAGCWTGLRGFWWTRTWMRMPTIAYNSCFCAMNDRLVWTESARFVTLCSIFAAACTDWRTDGWHSANTISTTLAKQRRSWCSATNSTFTTNRKQCVNWCNRFTPALKYATHHGRAHLWNFAGDLALSFVNGRVL